MIVKMKKVSVVSTAAGAEETVSRLRALGVMHVEHQMTPQGSDITSLTEDITLVREALNVLAEKEFLGEPCKEMHRVPPDWRTVARKIAFDRKRLDQLQEYSRTLKNTIIAWQPWGDFDPASISHLSSKNIFVGFYQVPEKEVALLPEDVVVKVISARGQTAYCCVISRSPLELPFKEAVPPRSSLTEMGARLMEDKKTVQAIVADIRKWTCYRESFLNITSALAKELEYHEALRGMGQAGPLAYLGGFVPVDAQDVILETARKEGWGILITDPSESESIPTLVRNPRWVSLIQPLIKLLEVLPGYTELDISPLFLIFFSLFFGMIIGDAGYGLLYLLIAFFLKRKFGAKIQDKRIFPLLTLLGFCAVGWGLLTGTFFGQAWLTVFGFKALVPRLNDPLVIQEVCFSIGVLHLTLAHSWRFIVQFPALTAFAELGWISILWGAFFLVKTLLLGAVFPSFGRLLIFGGMSLVVFCSSPKKNILAGIGAGLGNLALSIMNCFGDIISYVRLFAVGLAGVSIADAFNSMAAGAAGAGAFGFLAAGLILVAGHLLNFALSPMSVLVHGVRLNVLEFSGHAGVTWSGVPYKPLSKNN